LGDYNDANVVSGIQSSSGVKGVTMAFLDPYNNGCSLIWPGANGPLPNDTIGSTSVGAQIAALQAKGVTVIISGGGAGATDGSAYCSSASQVQSLYQSVINQYHVNWLDFDIEIGQQSGQVQRRDQAMSALQAANPGLTISYTLPVGPGGLDGGDNGTGLLSSAKSDGLNLNVVNVMAMDYGGSGIEMGSAATQAAAATESQIQSAGLSSKVSITPMIGQNDSSGEVFQLSDATTVVNFANSNSYVSLLSFWSMARDNGGCPGNPNDQDTCSSLSQSNYEFSSIFEAF
jgi:chitinase